MWDPAADSRTMSQGTVCALPWLGLPRTPGFSHSSYSCPESGNLTDSQSIVASPYPRTHYDSLQPGTFLEPLNGDQEKITSKYGQAQ